MTRPEISSLASVAESRETGKDRGEAHLRVEERRGDTGEQAGSRRHRWRVREGVGKRRKCGQPGMGAPVGGGWGRDARVT